MGHPNVPECGQVFHFLSCLHHFFFILQESSVTFFHSLSIEKKLFNILKKLFNILK